MQNSAIVFATLGTLLSALAVAPASAAQSLDTTAAPIPDTPAGRRLTEWLAVFNRGDAEAIKAYLRHSDPGEAGAPGLFVDVRDDTGPLIPFEIKSTDPDHVDAILAEVETDSFIGVDIGVEPAEPHHILSIKPRRLDRPANAPPLPKLSEPQLLAATKAKLDRDTAAGVFSGVLLLAHDGHPVFTYAGGLEDRERGVPNTLATRFGTASVGKVFTAVAVMQLAQAGKIDLNAPVGRYLPDYPNAQVAAKVTVDELLTHTGGTGDIFGDDYDRHRSDLRTPADYIRLFGNRDPVFEPGSRRGYSNFGFVILGRIIEKVSGQSWGVYERDHVFIPAGMTATGALPTETPVPHRAVGYTSETGSLLSTHSTSFAPSPAGGAYTTAGDLLKFVNALLADRLLDKAHTDLLLYGQASIGGRSYAYDLSGKAENGAVFIGHQGGGRGENADLRAFPANGYTLIILSNFGPPWQKVTQFVSNRLPTRYLRRANPGKPCRAERRAGAGGGGGACAMAASRVSDPPLRQGRGGQDR